MVKKHCSDLIAMRPLILYTLIGTAFGYLMGTLSPQINLFSQPAYFTPYNILDQSDRNCICGRCNATLGSLPLVKNGRSSRLQALPLPPGISVPQTDLYMRRLWGNPSEDLPWKPRYLVTFTVGVQQKDIIDRAVQKFSENFTVMLFHYDGKASDWDEFEWSRRAIHVSAPRQTKWWFAKRFLHPDMLAPYEYVFIWDEDLGLQNFDAEEYVKVVDKHGLEISQPALDPSSRGLTWLLTKRKPDVEVHKVVAVPYNNKRGGGGRCLGPLLPPCAAFVEMMAPVFSREAWKCVWKLIQNDLVHGWGLDFNFHRCVGGGDVTKRKPDVEVHKVVALPFNNKRGGGGWCRDPLLPPCAAFVEMMAPVFSREAWKCAWKLIQNDLVHGWGLDFNFYRCVGGGDVAAYERMGIVDSQWVMHQHLASLGLEGSVEERCLLGKEVSSEVR